MTDSATRALLKERLSGGDRRSIGTANDVAREAGSNSEVLAALVSLIGDDDPIVAMRAADAIEKATRTESGQLAPHAPVLLGLTEHATQQEVRWHLAQLLPRLELTQTQASSVLHVLETYLEDPSQIVRVNALQAIADLATEHAALRPRASEILTGQLTSGGKAVRARCRILLAKLEERT